MILTRATQFYETLSPRAKKLAPYLALVIAVFLAYCNVYGSEFLYDDEFLIVKNEFLRSWDYLGSIFTGSIGAGAHQASGFYRPLQVVLYLIVFQISELSLFGYHLLNIVLHSANACLVYKLGRKLRFQSAASFLAALVWALHPVHTEVIAYISGTADPLFAFFCLLTLVILLPSFKAHKFYIALPLFILGLLSKEEAVILPLLAVTCLFLLEKDRLKPKTYLRTWPLWGMAGLYAILHEIFLKFDGFQLYRLNDTYANSILCRLWTFLATLPSYLGFLVWPFGLHFDRDFQPVLSPWNLPVLGGFAMLAIAAFFVFRGRNRQGLIISWGLLWFTAAHLLHTGILVPVNAMLLEHWLYLPTVGIFLAAAQVLILALNKKRWEKYQTHVAVAALLLAAFLGVLSFRQNRVWRDPETFYLHIFKHGEPSPHAHNNLGILYTLQGKYTKAVEEFDLSIRLSGDTNAQAHHNMAIALLNGPNGKSYTQEAIKHFKRTLEMEPNSPLSSNALAYMYEQQGDKEEAAYYQAMTESIRKRLRP
ncbi:MAG: tetratricopeptide repeat protein [Alphaproteobacteria bacterium]|nr:tetratricopeptide repeat protein [Alphaproteobacteria bacterium]